MISKTIIKAKINKRVAKNNPRLKAKINKLKRA